MKIKEYLDKNKISIRAFAQKSGVSRHVIYCLMRGGELHLRSALAIQKASDSNVTLADMLPAELKERPPRRSGGKA